MKRRKWERVEDLREKKAQMRAFEKMQVDTKKNECFALERDLSYELYNPHQFKRAVAIVFTLPSFMTTNAQDLYETKD